MYARKKKLKAQQVLAGEGTESLCFKKSRRAVFIVLERWGGPQQDPHSYRNQI